MQLRDYQTEAVESVYRFLRERDGNPLAVLPVGAGKSIVIAQIVKDAVERWDGRVLMVTHSAELVEQNADKIKRLCPKLDVGVYSAGLKRRDTDKPVICAGIQSIYKRACELGLFDLLVIDEAHAIPANGEGMYRTFLADAKIVNPAVRCCGTTATPFRSSQGLIYGPDRLFEDVCCEIGIRELIAKGYLSPLITKSGLNHADTSGLSVRAGEFVAEDAERLMDDEHLIRAACAEIVELTRDRKACLIFASGVQHARHIADVLEDQHNVECGFVCADTPANERADLLARFRGDQQDGLFQNEPLKFLVNYGILTTGFDCPRLDAIALLRPTMSPGLLVQMVGRGTRLHPAKPNCIAEGQRVLTDVGLVEIQNLTTDMLVWDGVDFVNHEGAIFQGYQEIIEYAGLECTPDHSLFTEDGWKTAEVCEADDLDVCVTGDGRIPIKHACGHRRSCSSKNVGKEPSPIYENDLSQVPSSRVEGTQQPEKTSRGVSELRTETEQIEAFNGSTPLVDHEMHCRQTTMCQRERNGVCALRWSRDPVQFSHTCRNGDVHTQDSRVAQGVADRPHRQRRSLREGESEVGAASHQHEQPTALSQHTYAASLSRAVSRCEVRRCDIAQPASSANGVSRNRQAVLQPSINKAQRRVWDVLNAGPRNRFTCEGLLVSNCFVLDYAENIVRHGPIDLIKAPDPKKKGTGEAPAKECPQCRSVIAAGYAVCPDCGHEFPPPERQKHEAQAAHVGILSGQVTDETYEVRDVRYSVHTKKDADEDAPKSMRVDYMVGLKQWQSEWICVEHRGYARRKAEGWWHRRSPDPVPMSAEEAVVIADAGGIAMAEQITVRNIAGERFDRIIDYQLGPVPEAVPYSGIDPLDVPF